MSQQNITELSKVKYAKDAEDILIYNFEQYFYHKNFRISDGMNEEETTHNRYLLELLCANNCEVYNALYDKISGIVTNKPKKKKSISYLIKEWNEENNITIDSKNFWNEKFW